MPTRSQKQDRIRTAAEVGAVVGGSMAGAAAAPAAASLAGVTTLPLITKAAALVGATVVSATPVGWIVGCAALAGAVAYGVAKIAGDGGEVDGEQHAQRAEQEEAADHRLQARRRAALTPAQRGMVLRRLSAEVQARRLSPSQARRADALVGQGALAWTDVMTGFGVSTARRAAVAPSARARR